MNNDPIGPLGEIHVKSASIGVLPGIDINSVTKESAQRFVTDEALSTTSKYYS
nr:hypothetical protein [Corynebacterium sp. HMSC078H07]